MVLTNARHMAQGDGVSYDGHSLNNGFQPLWVFLNAPVYRLVQLDPEKMVRATFLLHWLFFLGSVVLFGAITRDAISLEKAEQKQLLFWLGALVYGGALATWQKQFNGLETSCALFFYALVWRYYQSGRAETRRGAIGLGALLGLLVLARIDTVFLVILLSIQRLFISRGQPLAERLVTAAAMGTTAFLVSLPWWAYNVIQFGHLTPTSGLGLQAWGFVPKRVFHGVDAAATMLTPHYYDGDFINHSLYGGRVILGVRIVVALLLLVWLWRRREALGWRQLPSMPRDATIRQATRPQRTLEFALVLAISNVVLLVWYVVSSWAWFFYERYLTPWMLLVTPAYALVLFEYTRRWRWLPAVGAILLAVPITLVSIATHFDGHLKKNIMLSDLLPLVKKSVPDADWIAISQSGTVGYFRDRVVNLAGVSNMAVIPFQDHMW
ncbi:MAG: hypothetical protein HQL62_00775, partial [Magnetococcales bacterium]|nr:hypothetical protein [Magnetococcales bacterium]